MAELEHRRHPVRGLLWGLLGGLGAALFLIGRAVIAFGTLAPVVVIVLFGILGVVWGWVGPARAPRDGDPATAPTPDAAPTAAAPAGTAAGTDDGADGSPSGDGE